MNVSSEENYGRNHALGQSLSMQVT